MLIPIGSWCRTAYQVREFKSTKNNATSESFPFDWTITSFAALRIILSPEFNPSKTLEFKNLSVNKLGSLSDSYSNLIFHHDLSPALLAKYQSSAENLIDISPELIYSGAVEQAYGRFVHTFIKLKESCKSGHEKIGFIRWCRMGHPDRDLPSVFTDENIFSLYEILQSFCGHNKFYVLRIITQYVDDLPSESSVLKYHKYSNLGASILLAERPGHNGDRTVSFAGDCLCWTEALTRFTLDFEIDPN
jgi:hypothetical protein